MKQAIVAVLGVVLMLPTGVAAQSADDMSNLWAQVPAGMEYSCQELGYDTFKRVVEPSIAALQCFYEGGPNKIDDVGLFLFDSKSELRAFWKARKEQRLGRATRGDCTRKNGAGVMDIPGGELICYESSGQARTAGSTRTTCSTVPWTPAGPRSPMPTTGGSRTSVRQQSRRRSVVRWPPSESEAAAIYQVRAELIEALVETKTEWAKYTAYRDEPSGTSSKTAGAMSMSTDWPTTSPSRAMPRTPAAFEVLSRPAVLVGLVTRRIGVAAHRRGELGRRRSASRGEAGEAPLPDRGREGADRASVPADGS